MPIATTSGSKPVSSVNVKMATELRSSRVAVEGIREQEEPECSAACYPPVGNKA